MNLERPPEMVRSPSPPTRSRGDRLRVCHLGKYYPPAPGGMETHVQTLAKAQAEVGAEVAVLCVNHDARSAVDGTEYLFAPPTVRTWDGPVRLTRLGRRASLARFDVCPDLISWMDQVQKDEVDLVHLHVPNPT